MILNSEEISSIRNSMIVTKLEYESAREHEDTIIRALNVLFDNIDFVEVSFEESQECESSGETLQEVIACYLNYGEGNIDKIVDLIIKKAGLIDVEDA